MCSSTARSCSGFSATSIWIVEQFGFATMAPPLRGILAPFTSGTTSGTSGSMRNAALLSTTRQPFDAAMGPHCRATDEPAENSASRAPSKTSGDAASRRTSTPRKRTVPPADRSDATARSERTGKARCSSTRSISWPTAPVAPTSTTSIASPIAQPLLRGRGAVPSRRRHPSGRSRCVVQFSGAAGRGHRLGDRRRGGAAPRCGPCPCAPWPDRPPRPRGAGAARGARGGSCRCRPRWRAP